MRFYAFFANSFAALLFRRLDKLRCTMPRLAALSKREANTFRAILAFA